MNPQLAAEAKVLIIDDQVLAKGYMKYSLEELGFTNITYVDKINNALQKIRMERFDLVICSYNLKHEHDGYFLYEQLKHSHELPPSTAFIFISADTTSDLVHSIVELQPDDFIAKPFTVNDLDKRVSRVLARKRAMRKVYNYIERKQFSRALTEVELFLADPDNAEFYPLALKTKGELLFACGLYQQAKEFYQAILNVQTFTWAQLGLVNAYIHLNEDEKAEKLVIRLAFKVDSQLAAYDLLSALQIKQQDFDAALECVMMTTEISPRNLRRHKKVLDLSRLTHDYQVQFEAAKKIVKFAKDSIHDVPENYLNVARAGIDYAMTAEDEETDRLIRQTQEYLKQLKATFPKADMQDQLTIINARLLYLQDEKSNARTLLEQLQPQSWENESLDSLMDKAKAFHELGLFERALSIIHLVEQRCLADSGQGELFLQYVKQQKTEKANIHLSPKELNNTAVNHYQHGDLKNAINFFGQAFSIMPKNPSIALNLLQSIVMDSRLDGLDQTQSHLIQSCIKTIENSLLNEEQEERYHKVRNFLNEAV